MNKRKILIMIVIMLFLGCFVPKKVAEYNAIRYMKILTIYDEVSYQEVKDDIYNISSDYVKNTLFQYQEYPLPNRHKDFYIIHSIRSDFVGFNRYDVYIDFTINNSVRMISVFEVSDGTVQDSYRISE